LKRQAEIKRGHTLTISERLAQESFLPLPALPYESYRMQVGKINSQGLVRFQNNDYSVPTILGQQTVLVKGYVDRVHVIHDHKIVAEHKRCYESESIVFNPMHYLTLLERKAGAFHQAAPLKAWNLPLVFERVQRRLEQKDGKEGVRSYIRILQLLETYPLKDVDTALKQALALDVVTEGAILHLVKRCVEKRPFGQSSSSSTCDCLYARLKCLWQTWWRLSMKTLTSYLTQLNCNRPLNGFYSLKPAETLGF
jgi:hypothetical protein